MFNQYQVQSRLFLRELADPVTGVFRARPDPSTGLVPRTPLLELCERAEAVITQKLPDGSLDINKIQEDLFEELLAIYALTRHLGSRIERRDATIFSLNHPLLRQIDAPRLLERLQRAKRAREVSTVWNNVKVLREKAIGLVTMRRLPPSVLKALTETVMQTHSSVASGRMDIGNIDPLKMGMQIRDGSSKDEVEGFMNSLSQQDRNEFVDVFFNLMGHVDKDNESLKKMRQNAMRKIRMRK